MSVRNALLGLLGQRPRHGYELHAAFEAVVGGKLNWDVKPAQIYTTLSRLAERGLVVEKALEQAGGPEKRIFAITPEGRNELLEWLAAPVKTEHQRDKFFLKLMLSLATGEVDPGLVIYAQRASLYQELHDLTIQRENVDPASELSRIMMLDRAIMHLEADLRWLDMIEARLDDIRRQPLPEPKARPRGRPPKTKNDSSGR
ncbi:MAG: PadR family transcriptional regulator [Actinobacteria bacterium]|nr:PadR family transcriptional regulator [Actinomycetota bacterium]